MHKYWLGYAYATVGAIGFAASAVLTKLGLQEGGSPMAGLTVGLFFGSLFLFLADRRLDFNPGHKRKAIVILSAAGFLTSIAQLLRYFAFSMAPLIVVSPIMNINALFTLITAHLFLRKLERVTIRMVLAALLVVLGAIMIARG